MSESKDLAVASDSAVAHRSESSDFIAAVLAAARDPEVDPSKMESLANLAMALQRHDLEMREVKKAEQFNRDFNAALADMPTVEKGGAIVINDKDGHYLRTQGRYARFEDIDRVVRPILRRHNLAMRFEIGEKDQCLTVRPVLSHTNGYTERGDAMRLPAETSGSKNNTQGAGSAASYGKRYTMCAMLNIVTEGTDDDGSLGKFAVGMTNERKVTVLEEAEAASAADEYQSWFDRQGVKDRAWLVEQGHHSRLGGAPAIQDKRQSEPTPSRAAPPPPPPPAATPQGNDTATPEGWTKQYEEDCGAAASIEQLERVITKGKKAMGRLEENGLTKLHDRALYAQDEARDRLRDGGLFGGDN